MRAGYRVDSSLTMIGGVAGPGEPTSRWPDPVSSPLTESTECRVPTLSSTCRMRATRPQGLWPTTAAPAAVPRKKLNALKVVLQIDFHRPAQ
jgi:hypothetical protein